MRSAMFAFIFSLISSAAFACGDWSIGENFTALSDAINYTAGNVEGCWTNPKTGASNLRCDEVSAADKAGAFSAHYMYERDDSKSIQWNWNHGYINCTPITSKDILENLALGDFAQATENALACNLPLLNELQKSPRSTMSMDFLNKAYDSYHAKFDDLRKKILDRDTIQSTVDLGKSSCQMRGAHEFTELPKMCQGYLSTGTMDEGRLAKLNEEIQVMEAGIPFMSDSGVQKAVEDVIRSGNSSKEAVFPAYYGELMTMRSEMDAFHSELVAARAGGNRYNLLPSTKRRLWQIADYDKIIDGKEKLSPHLKSVIKCMHDRRNVGASRITAAIYGASALSMIFSGGASAGVIALGATARGALVTLDLAVGGVSAIRSGDAIYNTCYKGATINLTGQTCSPQQSFDFVMQRTNYATCAQNIVTGVGIVGGIGVSVKGLNSTMIGTKADTLNPTNLIPQKPTKLPFVPQKK